MCDPLTIAGIALTAGSTVANTMAQNKVAKARSQALNAERMRQQGLEREAETLNAASQDRYGPAFDKGRQQTAQQLGDFLSNQDITKDTAIGGVAEAPPADSSSDIMVQESNRQQQNAKAFTKQQGQSRGQLLSFGDYLGDTSRLQGRDASLIGQIGDFMKGSSSIVPYELDAASHKGDSLKAFGDILNFGGSLAMGKGLQNPNFDPMGASSAAGVAAGTAGPWGAALPAATDPWAGLRTVVSSPSSATVGRSGRVRIGNLYAGNA
jgi:hypothetical protein